MKQLGNKWRKHGISWLKSDEDLFVMEYSELKTNLRSTVNQACDFLNLSTSDSVLDCLMNNQEGAYHRAKSSGQELLVFSREEEGTLKQYERHVKWYMDRRCPDAPVCLKRSQVEFTNPPYVPPKINK